VTEAQIGDFIIQWARVMREHPATIFPPSTRTGTSIARLLAVENLRHAGGLGNPHLVSAAVCVSPPEDKSLAKELAEKVVLGQLTVSDEDEAEEPDDCTGLLRILAEIKIAEALHDSDPHRFSTDLELLLADPLFQELISMLGGESTCRASYETREALEGAAKDRMREQFGALTAAQFRVATKLGMLREIEQSSPSKRESLAAQSLHGNVTVEEALRQCATFNEKARLLELLQAMGSEVGGSLEGLAALGPVSMERMLTLAALGYRDFSPAQVLQAIESELPQASFEQVFEATARLGGALTTEARRALFDLCGDELDAETLARHATLLTEWKTAMLRALDRKVAATRTEQGFAAAMETIRSLHTLCRLTRDPYLAQHVWEGCKQLAPAALAAITRLEHVKEFVTTAEGLGLPFVADDIRAHARTIGLPEHLVEEVLLADLALFKKMVGRGEKVYERFAKLLRRIRPQTSQAEELVLLAVKCQNNAALAALGLYDLSLTLSVANREGKLALEITVSSLSAGPGTDLLVQWFNCRDAIPKAARDAVRNLARHALVEQAVTLGKELMGECGRGAAEMTEVRPFVDGDDLFLIDTEETLDAILQSGKAPSSAQVSDSWVRQTSIGRRTCVLLLDVSGSMGGDPLTWSAVAAAMAVYSLRADEVAVAFFESDAHVVKALSDHRKTLDEVADELLDLSAMGGTMLDTASVWALDQFRQSTQREKRLLLLTDCAIYDASHCSQTFSAMASLGTRTTVFVPGRWAAEGSREIARWSRGSVVDLGDRWRRFPHLVAEALR